MSRCRVPSLQRDERSDKVRIASRKGGRSGSIFNHSRFNVDESGLALDERGISAWRNFRGLHSSRRKEEEETEDDERRHRRLGRMKTASAHPRTRFSNRGYVHIETFVINPLPLNGVRKEGRLY